MIYIAIDECYDVDKLTTLDEVVRHCERFELFLKGTGEKITKTIARQQINNGGLYLITQRDVEDERLDADWNTKIVKLS